MTTLSERAHIDFALKLLAERRPDIEVERTRGFRLGRTRCMQVWLKGGAYAQVAFPRMGVHTKEVAEHLAQAIIDLHPRR